MQVMPATGRLLSRREGRRGRVDLALPEENVRLGGRLITQLSALFGGDIVAVLAGYNAGPGRVARWRRESAGLAPDEWVEAMPFYETRDYVKRVLFFSRAYASLYGLADPPAISSASARRVEAVRPAAAPTGSSPPSGGK